MKRKPNWIRPFTWLGMMLTLLLLSTPRLSAQVLVTNTVASETLNSAIVSGTVTGESVNVAVYYGTADGLTTNADWQAVTPTTIGLTNGQSYAIGVYGLTKNTTYYARAYATAGTNTAWAANTLSFTTLADREVAFISRVLGGVAGTGIAAPDTLVATNQRALTGFVVGSYTGVVAATTNQYLDAITGLTNTSIYVGGILISETKPSP